ncbi:MAG: tetratricopeptide repeat protein [Vicinamibacterales bacterium]
MQRAEALRAADRTAEATAARPGAFRQLTALGREDTERAGTLLNNWGLVLGRLGRPLEAERMLRRSIAVSLAGGSDARVEAISWSNLARALTDLGRYEEALPLVDRAVRLARQRGDTVVADQAQLQAARIYVFAGRLDHGQALLDDVEARFRRMFPSTHVAFTAVAIDRARLALERGQLELAARLADETVTAFAAEPRFQVVATAGAAAACARAPHARPVRRARADAERLLPLVRARAPEGLASSPVAGARLLLGEALAGLGHTADARAQLTESLRETTDAAGADHPNARRARELLAGL